MAPMRRFRKCLVFVNTLHFFLAHLPNSNHLPPTTTTAQKKKDSKREKCCYSFLLFVFSHMWTWTACPAPVLGDSSMQACNLRSTPYWWSSQSPRVCWCTIIPYSTVARRMTASAVSNWSVQSAEEAVDVNLLSHTPALPRDCRD